MIKSSKRLRVDNQKGATLVEATFILPIFFMFSFAIMLICIQLFSVYSTYYACFQSLKITSTGPSRDAKGAIVSEVEPLLLEAVRNNFKAFRSSAKIEEVIVRNNAGCFMLHDRSSYQNEKIGCGKATSNQLKINPNTWVTLEVPVRPIGIKIKEIPIPEMRVQTKIKMYDWIVTS